MILGFSLTITLRDERIKEPKHQKQDTGVTYCSRKWFSSLSHECTGVSEIFLCNPWSQYYCPNDTNKLFPIYFLLTLAQKQWWVNCWWLRTTKAMAPNFISIILLVTTTNSERKSVSIKDTLDETILLVLLYFQHAVWGQIHSKCMEDQWTWM